MNRLSDLIDSSAESAPSQTPANSSVSPYDAPLSATANRKVNDLPSTRREQPWRKVWPNEDPVQEQGRRYGFQRGERLEIFGNAGNFFTDGRWTNEYECDAPVEPEQRKDMQDMEKLEPLDT